MKADPRLRLLALPLLAFALAACSPGAYVVLMKNADGSSGRIHVSGAEGQVEVAEPGVAATLDRARPELFRPGDERIRKDFAGALAAAPAAPMVFRLYFQPGGTALTAESEALLPAVVAEVAQRPGADLSIVGHTDTAGAAADNAALGLQRARHVEARMRAGGLVLERVTVDSHGEGNLLVSTPDNTAEPRNRRVEVVVR